MTKTYPRAWIHRIPMRTFIDFDSAATMHPTTASAVDSKYTFYR